MAEGSGDAVNISALPKMVKWYSPAHLVSTGWRSIVSELFGQYADQRIMQATIDGFAPEVMAKVVGRYNYSDLRELSDGETVWVDYVADLGDGFEFHLRDGLADQRALPRRCRCGHASRG